MARNASVDGAGCSFRRGAVYAIRIGSNPGVIRVGHRGHARHFAGLPASVSPRGIAFDSVGRFGHRLLVIARIGKSSSARVFSVDCRGRVHTVVASMPKVEGGIEVAPPSFGQFGGKLIAPSEATGRIWAIGPKGGTQVVAKPNLHAGPDIGVESLGFVPRGVAAHGGAAYVADRLTPGNPHPGTGSILRLGPNSLGASGIAGGDLLAATEAGAQTVRVRCNGGCSSHRVARGAARAHLEGHIEFLRG
jgi:hypothetical protein